MKDHGLTKKKAIYKTIVILASTLKKDTAFNAQFLNKRCTGQRFEFTTWKCNSELQKSRKLLSTIF